MWLFTEVTNWTLSFYSMFVLYFPTVYWFWFWFNPGISNNFTNWHRNELYVTKWFQFKWISSEWERNIDTHAHSFQQEKFVSIDILIRANSKCGFVIDWSVGRIVCHYFTWVMLCFSLLPFERYRFTILWNELVPFQSLYKSI